jgi:hypothetical protein
MNVVSDRQGPALSAAQLGRCGNEKRVSARSVRLSLAVAQLRNGAARLDPVDELSHGQGVI